MRLFKVLYFVFFFGITACSDGIEKSKLETRIDSLEHNIYLKDKILKAYEDMLLEESVVVGYQIENDSAIILEIVEDDEEIQDSFHELGDSLFWRN